MLRQRLDVVGANAKPSPVNLLLAEDEFLGVLQDAMATTEREILGSMLKAFGNRWLVENAVVNASLAVLNFCSDIVKAVGVAVACYAGPLRS